MRSRTDIAVSQAHVAAAATCYVLIVAMLVLAVVPPEVPSPTARGLIVAFGMTPGLLFAVAHYFYEGTRARPVPAKGFVVRSVLTALLMVLPAVLYWSRHLTPMTLRLTFLFGILFPLIASIVWDDGSVYGKLFAHFKYVMIGHWRLRSEDRVTPTDAETDRAELHRLRERLFVDKVALQEFQSTLTCARVDADAVGRVLWRPPGALLTSPVDVFDIGGGEGQFMSHLLASRREWNGPGVTRLHAIDPVDWDEEYRETIEREYDGPVTFVRRPFPEDGEDRQFGLVVASHSLYALWRPGEDGADRLVRAVMRHVKPDGLAVIILASGSSRSYRFKRAALRYLFDVDPDDLDAEAFRKTLSAFSPMVELVTDNVIDVHRHVLAAAGSAEVPAHTTRWLSYFLRYDLATLPRHDVSHLLEMLKEHAEPFRDLPRAVQDHLAVVTPATMALTPQSAVLTHKSTVLVFRKT